MSAKFNNATIESIIEKGFEINIGQSFSEGWQLCKKTMLHLIGFSLLLIGGSMAIFMLSGFVLQSIPALMIIVGLVYIFVFAGLFMGYYTFLVKVGKGNISFGNFFIGFEFIGQLIIYYILMLALQLPVIFFVSFVTDTSMFSSGRGMGGDQLLSQLLTQGYSSFLSLLFIFVFFLIADKDISCTKAISASTKIVMNKFLHFILLAFVLLAINVVGALLLVIGLFITIPLTFCIIYVVYQSIFGLAINSVLNERISSFGETESNSPFSTK